MSQVQQELVSSNLAFTPSITGDGVPDSATQEMTTQMLAMGTNVMWMHVQVVGILGTIVAQILLGI